MGLLDELAGGGERQGDFQDFVGRYDQGAPYEGIGDDEALSRHEEIASELSPDDYRQAAHGAFEQMSPDDRSRFGEQLAGRAQEQGYDVPGVEGARDGDPGALSDLVGGLHEQGGGGLLGQLVGGAGGGGGGGGGGDMLGGGAGKGALAGIAAMAAKRFMGGG